MQHRWRKPADASMRALSRILVRTYFRSVEVSGAAGLPEQGPLLEVANHHNGLVDALVLIATSPRYPRFLAKSTLWRIVPLRPFLALAGAIPVYRGVDAGVSERGSEASRAAGNRDALSRAATELAEGGTIGVFPEGVSHDLASLQELRTGAARLALDARGREGTAEVVVAPAGLFYDDKARFRSRALVRFGPPRPVGEVADLGGVDARTAVARLTAGIATELRRVGPDFDTVALADCCNRLARLAASDLVDEEALARRLAAAADRPGNAARIADLAAAARSYEASLKLLGVDDRWLSAAAEGRVPARRATGRAAAVVTVPAAAFGIAVHAAPYLAMRAIGRRPANLGMRSTVKLLGSFGLYLVGYVALGVAVGRRRGATTGLAAALAAPACGWAALRYLEESADLGAWRRASLLLRRRPVAADLLGHRRELVAAIRAVADPPERTAEGGSPH